MCSCVKAPEMIDVREIGCAMPDLEVTADAGECSFDILSSGECEVSFDEQVSWISITDGDRFEGDGTVRLKYSYNRGETRKATLTVRCGGYSLPLSVTQNGILSSDIKFIGASMLIPSQNGMYAAQIVTLLDISGAELNVDYEEEGGWIDEGSLRLSGTQLKFAAAENPSSARRCAVLTISVPSSVGDILSASIRVVQQSYGEGEPVLVSVGQVRKTAGDILQPGLVLVGRALNDDMEGNGAENQNYSAVSQDLTASSRTVYLQSLEEEDGRYYGIRLEFDKVQDNIINRYDKVMICLDGKQIVREEVEGEPVRYALTGLKITDVLATETGGRAELPRIEKKMSQLTDEDIYTFVTVTDCAIPVRKGPFVPIHLQYRTSVNKYPMVLLDADGSCMYMVTNTTATWSRDGKGMPHGSGNVSGVIVHEKCDNFEWNSALAAQKEQAVIADYVTDTGYIGPYQIRPVYREDIDLAKDMSEASVHGLLCEWRYYNADHPDAYIQNVEDGVIYATWPEVMNPLDGVDNLATFTYSAYGKHENTTITAMTDWTHLGPVKNNKITDLPGSCGVKDADGIDIHWSPYSSLSTSGVIQSANGSAFRASYWYDIANSHSKPRLNEYYWQMDFSTSGLSSANAPLSIQLGSVNGTGSYYGAPRYWVLKWSVDGKLWETLGLSSYNSEEFVDLTGKMGEHDGKDYTYSVPDFPVQTDRKIYNCPAYKYMSFTIPASADIWGKEHVYVRLHAAMDISGYDGSYDGDDICNNRANNINYAAVRYRK